MYFSVCVCVCVWTTTVMWLQVFLAGVYVMFRQHDSFDAGVATGRWLQHWPWLIQTWVEVWGQGGGSGALGVISSPRSWTIIKCIP